MPSAQLEVAIQACRKAGNFINRESLDLSAIEAREKAPFDFVSRVDTGAQERITSIIRQYFPKDSIVAEESGTIVNPGADGVWYVDPLDGTTNFLHGFPHYAVSIAYALKGRVMAAAVYDPVKDELFSAERSRGAFLNNARIRVSGRTDMSKSLIGTGFPFRFRRTSAAAPAARAAAASAASIRIAFFFLPRFLVKRAISFFFASPAASGGTITAAAFCSPILNPFRPGKLSAHPTFMY